ncbi:hypothetical protein OAO87_01185 [bacterium]|nr:hypothetical protein [bacterium]
MHPPAHRNFVPVADALSRPRGMVSSLGALRYTTQGSVKLLQRDVAGSDVQRQSMLTQSLADRKRQQAPLIGINDFATRSCLNGFHRDPIRTKLMTVPKMRPRVLVSTYD